MSLGIRHRLRSQQPLGGTCAPGELLIVLHQEHQLGRQRVRFLGGGCCFQGLDRYCVLLVSDNVALGQQFSLLLGNFGLQVVPLERQACFGSICDDFVVRNLQLYV